MNSPIEQDYINALNRLIKMDASISLNKVAKEAGKKEGSLRKERFPFVCQEVQRAIELRDASNSKPKKKVSRKSENETNESLRQELVELKNDYAVALQKIISLENQLFEMRSNVVSIKPLA
ncbi:hypothetical protein Q9252_16335 [Marinobacter salarius]|uniref:hypothetical protein n=1 Tax=Marinobacter salarius TaxID=1420917 RepID=UPI00273C0F2C|nr:hypothetical protein [Marinobacter salarius]MDP4533713.1 hypothetical protein [Marinobacter salarius]